MPYDRQSNHIRSSGPSSKPSQPSRLERVRVGIYSMFSGRSTIGPRSPNPDSSKPLRFVLDLPNLPTTRLEVPYISRNASNPSRSSSQRFSPSSISSSLQSDANPQRPISSRPITPNSFSHQIEQATAFVFPSHHGYNFSQRFVSLDPAEQQLAEIVQAGRARRRRDRRHSERKCTPRVENRRIRAKIVCFVSGLFLTLVLTVYLAMALSNRTESEEFHVLLILIILVTTIFFCHALIRLCIMLMHPPKGNNLGRQFPGMIGPEGYAQPEVPIRVALARDEEAVGIKSEATKMPPPAYGLWRESVRVDPNQIFWQRNRAAALQRQNFVAPTERRPATAHRPPSYVSENGVDYVVEAAPRLFAPNTDLPLPPHPSERGAWSR